MQRDKSWTGARGALVILSLSPEDWLCHISNAKYTEYTEIQQKIQPKQQLLSILLWVCA